MCPMNRACNAGRYSMLNDEPSFAHHAVYLSMLRGKFQGGVSSFLNS